jgi:hypothetical protein
MVFRAIFDNVGGNLQQKPTDRKRPRRKSQINLLEHTVGIVLDSSWLLASAAKYW